MKLKRVIGVCIDIKTQMLVAEQVHWRQFEKVRSKNVR